MKLTKQVSHFRIAALIVCAAILPTSVFTSCSDDDNDGPDRPYHSVVIGDNNLVTYITDNDKLAMLRGIKDLDGTGRIYEINYTEDYELDDALEANITNTGELLKFVQKELFDIEPQKNTAVMKFTPGCSAFAVPERGSSGFLMGRNYDFCHATKDASGQKNGYIDIAAFVVRTAPKDGYKSISFVDGYNFGYKRDFHKDPNQDLSLLIGLPYACLDGINEKGFAIGVLSLNEAPTMQADPTKPNIYNTVAMRLLLDHAATVDEAIDMLKKYNMRMANTDLEHNYHYFMADAKGNYAIVEYTRNPKVAAEKFPTRMEVLNGNDTLRCVTNFYVSPTMAGTNDGWGSKHGLDRYNTLRKTLRSKGYTLSGNEAMNLLKSVAQAPSDDITSQTQWSATYNLSERTVRLTLLRDFAKEFKFRIE